MTRLNPRGAGLFPFSVTLPVIVPPSVTVTSWYAGALETVSRLPMLRLTNNAKEYFQRRRCNCFMPITSYLPIKNYTTGRKRAGEPQTRVRLPHPNVLLCRHGFTSKRSEEHTSELQSPCNLVCRLLL